MAIKQLGKLGQEIFEARYAYPGEKTWGERAKAIARMASSAEKDEEKETTFSKFYDCIAAGDFIPGGRIIFGAGRDRQNSLNCYQISPEDSVRSIGKLINNTYSISCGGGGIGFNFSDIRPKGDDISNIKNSAPGSISVMRMINSIGDQVRAGKNRRTALIAILNVTHPDLFEFLHVKLDNKELNNFNISVGITDRFIEAVENDEDWYFTFNNRRYFRYELERSVDKSRLDVIGLDPNDAIQRALQHYKINYEDEFTYVSKHEIKARDIWNTIFRSSVECGDPGFFNIDLANRFTNVSYFERLKATNPCGEQVLPDYGNCCLGNINLNEMVNDDWTDVDWKRLANAVRVGIRFLDNILTINHYPVEECKEVAHRSRRIGLGVMGLHYMLIKLGYKYGSDKSLEFVNRLFTTIRDEAYATSIYLARDKGSFAAFDSKKYLAEEYAKTLPPRLRHLIKTYGIRNAVMLNIPPTGTTGMLMETSTGIEPIFAWAYKRRYRSGNVWKEQVIVDPLFKQIWDSSEKINNGDLDELEAFVGAYDVTPEEHLKMQAEVQKYLDSACSKTINVPKDTKWQDLSKIVLKYINDLKGVTLYKAGSKGSEPLEAIPLTEENIEKFMIDGDIIEGVESGALCTMNGDCG